MERNTPDGICTWLSEEFNRPGWHSARVAQELSNEVLDMVLMRYDNYHQSAKLGLLFALLYIRKNDLPRMQFTMEKLFFQAKQDADDWVRMTAHILEKVPVNRELDMNIERWSDSFGTLLTDISNGVKEHGISFHANEYAVMMPEAREDCIYGTEVYKANKPTLKQHFTLRNPSQQVTRANQRKDTLQALVQKERAEMASPISPTTGVAKTFGTFSTAPATSLVAGMTRPLPNSSSSIHGPAAKRQAIAPPSQGLYMSRGGAAQPGGIRRPPPARPAAPGAGSLFNTRQQARPMPSAAPGAKSMFIPSRKGSLGGTRPAPVRSVLPTPSTSSSAAPPTPTTPKGFQKQSRVQMLDFTESSKMLQDNNRKKDEAEKRIKGQREQQKQENALRRQQQREEEAKWKANAKAVKRQRTSTNATNRETGEPSSPTHPTSAPSSHHSSPTMPSVVDLTRSPTSSSSSPPLDANDENYLQQDPSRTFKGNPSSSSSMAV